MESRTSSSDDEGAEDDSGVVSEGGKIELASKEVQEGVDTPSLSTSSITASLREEGVEIISVESSQEDGTPPTEKRREDKGNPWDESLMFSHSSY